MNEVSENQRKTIFIALIIVAIIIIIIIAVNTLGRNNNINNNANKGNNGNVTVENGNLNYTVAENGNRINESQDVVKDKKVGNILIQGSSIVYENGTSQLVSRVVNDSIAKDNLRFTVRFIANDGSVITEAVGFVGVIGANETKEILSFVTTDVSNAKDLTYIVME